MTDPSRWGFTDEQWDDLADKGYQFLADVAGRGDMTNYSDLSKHLLDETELVVEPWGDPMRFLLGDIAVRSYEERGAVITALVQYKDRNKTLPAVGLFNISHEIGLLPEPSTMTPDDRDAFWIAQINASHQAYR